MVERVVLEDIQQVAMQGGRQARVVVVPVENVEGRWLLAQQVVVDPVVPHQIVGAHPGKHPAHVASIQHASLVGAALGRFQGLLIHQQAGRGVHLCIQQADQVGAAGNLAQLALGLQVALKRCHGEAAGAGADEVDLLAAGDGAAGIAGFFDRLYVGRKSPLAVPGIRIAPGNGKHLQAVFQGVLNEALFRAEIEDIELVDLRRHDQQGAWVLLFAHRLVLD